METLIRGPERFVDTVCPISVFRIDWPSSVLSAALESKYSLHEGTVCGYEPKIPSEKLIIFEVAIIIAHAIAMTREIPWESNVIPVDQESVSDMKSIHASEKRLRILARTNPHNLLIERIFHLFISELSVLTKYQKFIFPGGPLNCMSDCPVVLTSFPSFSLPPSTPSPPRWSPTQTSRPLRAGEVCRPSK
jgi:hypothetical protein